MKKIFSKNWLIFCILFIANMLFLTLMGLFLQTLAEGVIALVIYIFAISMVILKFGIKKNTLYFLLSLSIIISFTSYQVIYIFATNFFMRDNIIYNELVKSYGLESTDSVFLKNQYVTLEPDGKFVYKQEKEKEGIVTTKNATDVNKEFSFSSTLKIDKEKCGNGTFTLGTFSSIKSNAVQNLINSGVNNLVVTDWLGLSVKSVGCDYVQLSITNDVNGNIIKEMKISYNDVASTEVPLSVVWTPDNEKFTVKLGNKSLSHEYPGYAQNKAIRFGVLYSGNEFVDFKLDMNSINVHVYKTFWEALKEQKYLHTIGLALLAVIVILVVIIYVLYELANALFKEDKINDKGQILRTIHEQPQLKKYMIFLTLAIYFLLIGVSIIMYLSVYRKFPPFTLFTFIFFIYIFSKLVLSYRYEPYKCKKEPTKSIAILVPFFNEPVAIMKEQYKSFNEQTYQNFKVYYHDDGSASTETFEWLQEIAKTDDRVFVQRKENQGKRHCQIDLMKYVKEELIYTTDSDTVLQKECLYNLVQCFDQENLYAVTGMVQALNAEDSLLTKLLQIRYFSAFESERAAQSYTENVIVCSGPNSMYRRIVFDENWYDYTHQMFLGELQAVGDDRCLTNYSMKYGEVKYQSNAICYTEIPNGMEQFSKQQIRWGRSFLRETLLGLQNAYRLKLKVSFAWMFLEIIMVFIFLYSMGSFIIKLMNGNMSISDIIFFYIYIVSNAYIRNVYYLPYDFATYLKISFYGVVHAMWVTPLKIYSLLTLKKTKWGTR
ncbi:MAG: glycosyltransferase family 2 protein [Mycoplasmatales bacterium]